MAALLEFRGGDTDFGDGWQHQHTRIPSEREADRYDGGASLDRGTPGECDRDSAVDQPRHRSVSADLTPGLAVAGRPLRATTALRRDATPPREARPPGAILPGGGRDAYQLPERTRSLSRAGPQASAHSVLRAGTPRARPFSSDEGSHTNPDASPERRITSRYGRVSADT